MSKFDIDDFEADVIERSRDVPVLVDFWAAWCGPCRVLGPVLERLAAESERWELRKVDTEGHPDIARRYRISSIPAVKLFVDGEVRDEFVGALPERVIVQWLDKALPSRFRQRIGRAEALLAEKRLGEARELLTEILDEEPDDADALTLLAQAEMRADPAAAEARAGRVPLGSERYEAAEAVKTLARLFLRTEEAPESFSDSPSREGYVEGIARMREGDEAAALDAFIGAIRRDRYYDDDGARRSVVAIFALLGSDHATTRAYRNPFANALY